MECLVRDRATKASQWARHSVCIRDLGETCLRPRARSNHDAWTPALLRQEELACYYRHVRSHVLAALVTVRFGFPGASRLFRPGRSFRHSPIQNVPGAVALLQ